MPLLDTDASSKDFKKIVLAAKIVKDAKSSQDVL